MSREIRVRPVAVEAVALAVESLASGDPAPVEALLRRRTFGWGRQEKLRLMTTLAWMVADQRITGGLGLQVAEVIDNG